MADANDALFGDSSGAPAWSWKDVPVGTTIAGIITHHTAIQSTNYQTKELEFWPSGDKKMLPVITLATDLRDPTIEDDDGQRTVYIRGKVMTEGLRAAIKAVGAKKIEIGGQMFIRYTGLGKAEKGNQPPKLYDVGYRKPTPETVAAAARYEHRAVTEDPWADAKPDDGFGGVPNAAMPAASPQDKINNDPWATTPAQPSEAAQQPLPAGNGASGEEWVTLPDGNKVDVSKFPPEAAALMRKMAVQTA